MGKLCYTESGPSEQEPGATEELVKAVRERFRRVREQVGSLSERKRLARKWKGSEALLGQIDEALVDVWDESESKTLWDINCLLYTGAAIAEEWSDEPAEVRVREPLAQVAKLKYVHIGRKP